MDCKQEYTVFAERDDGTIAYFRSESDMELQDVIDEASCYSGRLSHSYRPVAWTVGDGRGDEDCAESIAAGRLIEKTPSGWVALGAEKQEENALVRAVKHLSELRKVDPSPADQTEPAFLKALRSLVAIQGENGNWNCDDYMCGLYNGLELALATVEGREPQYRRLSAPVVSQDASTAKPNPFQNYTAPDCSTDPDHLNASRHQMAGMSNS